METGGFLGLTINKVANHFTYLVPYQMTGYTDNSVVHHGVLEDGVALLQIPFNRFDLAANVRRVLDS